MEISLPAFETKRLSPAALDGRASQRIITASGKMRTRLHEALEEKKKPRSNGQGTPDFSLEPGPGRSRPRRKFEHLILRINQLKNRAAQVRFACLSYDLPSAIEQIEELRAEQISEEETRDRISQILRYVLSDKQKVKWKQHLAHGGIDEGMVYLERALIDSRRIREDVRIRYGEDIRQTANADASAHADDYEVKQYRFRRQMLAFCRRLMPHVDTEEGLEMYRTFQPNDMDFYEDVYYTMLPFLRAASDDRQATSDARSEALAGIIAQLKERVQRSPCRFPENPREKFHALVGIINKEVEHKERLLDRLRGSHRGLRESRKRLRQLRAGDKGTRKLALGEARHCIMMEKNIGERRQRSRRSMRQRQEEQARLRYYKELSPSDDLPPEQPPAMRRDPATSGTIEVPPDHEYLLHEDESYVITEESPFTVSTVTTRPSALEDNAVIAHQPPLPAGSWNREEEEAGG